jgi:FAD/FMN-containing dehydrogenase
MARVGAGETAFGDRAAPYLLGVEGNWEGPREDRANVTWVRECVADMQRFSNGGMYLNFPGFLEEGQEMIRDAYGENYERLVALKNEYDPTNLFRMNQNIGSTN